MKKLAFIFCLCTFVFCCSSSDDSNDDMDDLENEHYSLIVNGDGLTNERFELSRDSIDGGNVVKFTSSDSNGNRLYFVLPNTIEANQEYTINPYNINNSNVSSVTIMGNGIYLSVEGTISLTEVVTSANCIDNYIGSLNINYRRQDNAPGTLNVQGTFNVPLAHCD